MYLIKDTKKYLHKKLLLLGLILIIISIPLEHPTNLALVFYVSGAISAFIGYVLQMINWGFLK